MKDVTDLTLATAKWWFDAWTAQAAAVTTIALRLPIVMAHPNGREAKRMSAEKIAAAGEGAMAASVAAGRMMMGAAMGAGPIANAAAALAVATAASAPGHRRVNANAKRLSRRRHP